ncbi:MAG: hypothetical protein ABWY07_12595 [Burkholderiales bacterium]
MSIRAVLIVSAILAAAGCGANGGPVRQGAAESLAKPNHAQCVARMYAIRSMQTRQAVNWSYYDWCLAESTKRKGIGGE